MKLAAAALAAAALVPLSACTPSEGPLMAANEDCLGCHAAGGEGRTWTVAGTFGGQGSRIVLTDANGKTLTLRGARNGNFYTAESVAFPLRVSVDGEAMPDDVSWGGCNRCHGPGGAATTGPLMSPGEDCLACHDGVTAVAFGAAGTWTASGPNATVAMTDAGGKVVTVTTNQVGNFYTSEPLASPFTVSVNGALMARNGQPIPVTYGGCNSCHRPGATLTTGPEMAPGSDCLSCHRAGGAAQTAFSVAGTWFGPGHTVVVTASGRTVTMTTNRVGNFYSTAPLALPGTARVDGATMEDPLAYGGCGRCHGSGGGGEGGGD